MERVEHIKFMDYTKINGIVRFVYSFIIYPSKVIAKCSGLNDKPGIAGNCETIKLK